MEQLVEFQVQLILSIGAIKSLNAQLRLMLQIDFEGAFQMQQRLEPRRLQQKVQFAEGALWIADWPVFGNDLPFWQM